MSEQQKKEYEETVQILKKLDPQKMTLMNVSARVLHASQLMEAEDSEKK